MQLRPRSQNQSMTQQWTIPDYSVRISKRAKQVTIRVSPYTGLEVVIPVRFNKSKIPDILRSKARWIEKNLGNIQPVEPLKRPDFINLDLLTEYWRMEYKYAPNEKTKVVQQNGVLLQVTGSVDDPIVVAAALNQWIQKKAKGSLVSWLNRISKELSLPFNRVSVRRQRTKWGSCSGKKSISLNRNLLFVTPPMARYVLVHELCHCLILDHSDRFWSLLERYEPDARQTAGRMRDSSDLVPLWAQV